MSAPFADLRHTPTTGASLPKPWVETVARSIKGSDTPHFLRRRAQDPDFSAAKLARLSGLSCSSHVERELGLIATSHAVKNGVKYPGRIKRTIGVDNAERLLRAMGLQARDIERLLAGEELS